MSAETFAWVVPLALATFSGAFALLRTQGVGSYWWAAAFGLAAVAFGITILPTGPQAALKPLFEDALFLGAFAAFCMGSGHRSGTPAHRGFILCVIAGSLTIATIAVAGFGHIEAELVAVQTGVALLLLAAARSMKRRLRHLPDQTLFWLTILFALILVAQSAALILYPDPTLTIEGWAYSVWGFALQASGATAGVLFAIVLLMAIGRDMIEALRHAASTDALSGALNRRGFEEEVARLQSASPKGIPSCVLAVDLDHFKTVNDDYGHAAGDAVICAMATLLLSVTRQRGCVGRIGGEEFTVFLAGTSLREARQTAEALRTSFAAMAWPGTMADARITASFGLTDIGPIETFEMASLRADRLLYLAKSSGRDQVCWCSSDSEIVLPDLVGIGHPGGLRRPAPKLAVA
ncbi:GGDEF domain-containing protein [Aureimonas mangrovi]|uniref:GGDEF domain-containing protein n=1 Tax=Aureimonas mangrovi TaxID=2758041 RepID=UPI00163DC9B1|nr:GGDEF domain-containing protein [Aureimonas mangrovi]